MINFYDLSKIEGLKKKLTLYRVIFYILLAISISFIIALSFFFLNLGFKYDKYNVDFSYLIPTNGKKSP